MTQPSSTTLDRSILLLFELAANPEGLTVSELARRLGTQRAPLYRQLRSLTNGRLIRRAEDKTYQLGLGVLELARAFSTPINEKARPILQQIANQTGFTAHLSLAEGEALVLAASATPNSPGMHLTTRAGYTYDQTMSAPRVAMLASKPRSDEEPEIVSTTRARGYVSTQETWVRPGLFGISMPIKVSGMHGALSVIAPKDANQADDSLELNLVKPLQEGVRTLLENSL